MIISNMIDPLNFYGLFSCQSYPCIRWWNFVEKSDNQQKSNAMDINLSLI